MDNKFNFYILRHSQELFIGLCASNIVIAFMSLYYDHYELFTLITFFSFFVYSVNLVFFHLIVSRLRKAYKERKITFQELKGIRNYLEDYKI